MEEEDWQGKEDREEEWTEEESAEEDEW